MKNFKKEVQFDQLKPYYLTTDADGNTTEHLYDLSALLCHVAEAPLAQRKKNVLGDTQMFHVCKYDAALRIWEIQILHLREKILPGIADDDGTYELIQLGDNQYPAESTTILYDEQRCTLYMQRNIYGTSIRALEIFIQLLSPAGTMVLLKPVVTGTRINAITENRLYRKVLLTADSEQLTTQQQNQPLGRILRDFGRYQGRIIKVDIGFGKQRNGRLNAREVVKLVREAYEFNGTTRLEVRSAENEDTPLETIDLLDDKACYKLPVEYSRARPITHDRLYRICLGQYREDLGLSSD